MLKVGQIIEGSKGKFLVVDHGNFNCCTKYSLVNINNGKMMAMIDYLDYASVLDEDLKIVIGKVK